MVSFLLFFDFWCLERSLYVKVLSYEDRMLIARRLPENAPFGASGKELGKDCTTIEKEIKKYSYNKKSGRPGYPYNSCKFRTSCKVKSCVESVVRISQHINAVCVRNVHCTAWIS